MVRIGKVMIRIGKMMVGIGKIMVRIGKIMVRKGKKWYMVVQISMFMVQNSKIQLKATGL